MPWARVVVAMLFLNSKPRGADRRRSDRDVHVSTPTISLGSIYVDGARPHS
jgi:hypothetical protein